MVIEHDETCLCPKARLLLGRRIGTRRTTTSRVGVGKDAPRHGVSRDANRATRRQASRRRTNCCATTIAIEPSRPSLAGDGVEHALHDHGTASGAGEKTRKLASGDTLPSTKATAPRSCKTVHAQATASTDDANPNRSASCTRELRGHDHTRTCHAPSDPQMLTTIELHRAVHEPTVNAVAATLRPCTASPPRCDRRPRSAAGRRSWRTVRSRSHRCR